MHSKGVAIIGVSVLTLFFAFAVPAVIDAEKDPQTVDTELTAGSTFQVTEGLEISVTDTTNSEVTVDLVDTATRQNQTLVIAEGSTETYSLPGGDGSVKNIESTNQQAELLVEFDPKYGWPHAATVIANHVGLLLTVMAFVVIVSGITVVIS